MKSEIFNPPEILQPQIELEKDYQDFTPAEFLADPFGYFEKHGVNVKSGKIKHDATGRVREDPTAVKDLPAWQDQKGQSLEVIGKKVNIKKGEIGKSQDPFYEYKMMQLVTELGLPSAKPIARVSQENRHLIIMEKIPGIRWSDKEQLQLEKNGYTTEDISNLKQQAQLLMEKIQNEFTLAGVNRSWKLKDMIFDLDMENKTIKAVTPTDWERTKIDEQKIAKFKSQRKIS